MYFNIFVALSCSSILFFVCCYRFLLLRICLISASLCCFLVYYTFTVLVFSPLALLYPLAVFIVAMLLFVPIFFLLFVRFIGWFACTWVSVEVFLVRSWFLCYCFLLETSFRYDSLSYLFRLMVMVNLSFTST